MKILFFVLGSPYERMVGNRKDSFDDLLKEDIIFFGPSSDVTFKHNGKVFPIIQMVEETTISAIFQQLPHNWYPDIVVCETPVLTYISDIYRCPVKTLCLSRDAWGEMIYNRKMAEVFDCVYYQTVDIFSYKKLNTHLTPIIGSPISIPAGNIKEKPFNNRDIDILSIANYNIGMYHERYKLFHRVAQELVNVYNIKFITGVKYNEIHDFYKNSKIVIDWSNVMSCRSYEAILNGCLFFSYKDNPLIKAVWSPHKDYIPYDMDNIVDLLKYYLSNANESTNIITNAKKKIKNLPMSPGAATLERINQSLKYDISVNERINRIENWQKNVFYHCISTPLYFNYNYTGHNHPVNWQELYFKRINKALACKSDDETRIREIIEAFRFAFLLKDEEKCFLYLSELEKIKPEYAWIYYHKARLYFDGHDYDNVLINLEKAVDYCQNYSVLIQKYPLPFEEKNYPIEGRRIKDFIWKSIYNHNNEFQVKAFLHTVYDLFGDTYRVIRENQSAIECYEKAINEVPIPNTFHKYYSLLTNEEHFLKIADTAELAVNENPYDILSILHISFAYIKLQNNDKFRKLLNAYYSSLRCFYNKKSVINKLNYKKILVKGLLLTYRLPDFFKTFLIKKMIKLGRFD